MPGAFIFVPQYILQGGHSDFTNKEVGSERLSSSHQDSSPRLLGYNPPAGSFPADYVDCPSLPLSHVSRALKGRLSREAVEATREKTLDSQLKIS